MSKKFRIDKCIRYTSKYYIYNQRVMRNVPKFFCPGGIKIVQNPTSKNKTLVFFFCKESYTPLFRTEKQAFEKRKNQCSAMRLSFRITFFFSRTETYSSLFLKQNQINAIKLLQCAPSLVFPTHFLTCMQALL